MAVYEALKAADGTFSIGDEDMEELRRRHQPESIYSALLKIYELNREQEAKEVYGDLAPCSDCGGLNFLRTGNCHVCTTCGESQGCS